MNIYSEDADALVNAITLYLTKAEASELRDALESLLADPMGHEHVSNTDYSREITVCRYDVDSLTHFDARSRQIILEDK